MLYTLSIDWLSLFCKSPTGEIDLSITPWEYERAERGTRNYRELLEVTYQKEPFLQIQQHPSTSTMPAKSMIIKVYNRQLYMAGMWDKLHRFLLAHSITVQNISRLDIAADFNRFVDNRDPVDFIADFLNSRIRHIGKGNGAAHFWHRAEKRGIYSVSRLNYTGLSFGEHSSPCRVILYNKTYELQTVKDKPWIKRLWNRAGLKSSKDCPVWRLEIALTNKAFTFKDKETRERVAITYDRLRQDIPTMQGDYSLRDSFLSLIYFTFINSLFQFIINRPNITNVTREPRIKLFEDVPYITRNTISPENSGNRTERVLIRQLWQLSDKYRGTELLQDEGAAKSIALDLAESCNLTDWLDKKSRTWKKPKRI